jgi:hypothetical protein
MFAEAGCAGDSTATCIATALSPAKRQASAATSAIVTKPLPSSAIKAIAEVVESGLHVPGMVEGGVSFDSLGGAVGDVHSNATAFPWRSALADVQYTATWPYAHATEDPSPFDDFVRRERATLEPWLGTAAYVNYADAGLANYANAYWGPNLKQLQTAKQTYDPHNVFSFPQSVPLP